MAPKNTSSSGKDSSQQERQIFEIAIKNLLRSENPDFTALMAFIHARLYQFHLTGQHDSNEIFNIAYERGVKLTEKGVHIENPLGWLRRTIFNIVRELSRKDRKADSLDKEECLEPISQAALPFETLVQGEAVTSVHAALAQLSEVDRELLELRYLQGKSWLEVGQCVAIASKTKQTEATLRQRGHRALRRLRAIYRDLSDA
ncbi:MAG: sigma-70 family RNA polymerase sigma factor [Cyanothece sp. SIO2G6]|nr:sigma-70 family RNA polymerase sigma factor [Cyanothece sp. SIO2G6]